MNNVIYLILRRLRAPIITLIVVYAISILGYVIIPGADLQGNPSVMGFFDATYFVSYMGTTIGFGEIPYPFTEGQRAWTLLCIYGTVIAWLYSIGSVIAIFRDDAFLRVIQRTRFRQSVRRFREPFYLVCGYGVISSPLVRELSMQGVQSVVLDINPHQIESMELDDLPIDVPKLCGNAEDPEILFDAGLEHANCIGVLCITSDEHTNLSVAIASKLLAPHRIVISRVESKEYAANLASFGTDHIVAPYEIFADYFEIAIHYPYCHLLYDWLLIPHSRPHLSRYHMKEGMWVVCGYGRMGQALYKRFQTSGDEMVLIEVDLEGRRIPTDVKLVRGLGTESRTLLEAGIKDAVGIIAGTPDDANNLSILMTAHELKPDLIMVGRQNLSLNRRIFEAANIDIIMNPCQFITNKIMSLIRTPLLLDFLRLSKERGEPWCQALVEELFDMLNLVDTEPEILPELEVWIVRVTEENATAIYQVLGMGERIPLSLLYKKYEGRGEDLGCKPLLLTRGKEVEVTPPETWFLQQEDKVLFCGRPMAVAKMDWRLQNLNVLSYILTGRERSSGYLWKQLGLRGD